MDSRQSLFNSQSKLINDLEAGLNKHVNKRLEMEGRQQARANTLARREELEERLRKGAEEVERCDSELQPVEAVLEEEEGERVSRRRRAEEELEQRHCFKWLKFHFCELENSRLFDEFLIPLGVIIFLGL